MTRHHGDSVVERNHFLLHARQEGLVVSAGEVCASDRAREQLISREEYRLFGEMEAAVPGSVSGRGQHLKPEAGQVEREAVGEFPVTLGRPVVTGRNGPHQDTELIFRAPGQEVIVRV